MLLPGNPQNSDSTLIKCAVPGGGEKARVTRGVTPPSEASRSATLRPAVSSFLPQRSGAAADEALSTAPGAADVRRGGCGLAAGRAATGRAREGDSRALGRGRSAETDRGNTRNRPACALFTRPLGALRLYKCKAGGVRGATGAGTGWDSFSTTVPPAPPPRPPRPPPHRRHWTGNSRTH
jgi:hypothetical protein